MEGGSNGGGMLEDSRGYAIVVGPQYCAPHLVDLTFTKKVPGGKSGHLAIVDADGKVVYKVERRHFTMKDRHLLLDASEQPLLLMQSERKTSHAVYDVFRGDSTDAEDLLFKIKKVSAAEVQVFLAANSQQYSCDFTVRGDINNGTVAVFRGDSTEIEAQMSKECKFTCEAKEEGAFGVAVGPNVDSCFIAALFVVLREVSSAKIAGADNPERPGGGASVALAAAVIEGVTESVTGKLIELVSDLMRGEE